MRERDGVNLRYRSGRLGERERERERERETMSISVAMPVDWGGERRRSRETVVERGKSRLGLRCWNEMLGGSFDFFFFHFKFVYDGYGPSILSLIRRKIKDDPCPSVNQALQRRALGFLT